METLIIIGLIIIIVLLINTKNNLENKINQISAKVDFLKADLRSLTIPQNQETATVKKEEPLKEQASIPAPTPKIEPVVTPKKEPIQQQNIPPAMAINRPVVKPKEKSPSFFERHPDMEKFIGENLINKIGIGILVLGIGFFVKYAIDQDWINEIGRVFIGILCGGILVGTAHKMRKNFKAFSSVLVGGGMAVFYLTIAIAFHEYQLFSQTAAFVIMVIITVFSVLLSLAYNRMELAILAIIGGFASPFMVSTGEGNYIVLFTYILILNVGMIVLAYFKKWNLVNIISYIFTILLYGGWLVTKMVDSEEPPYTGAFIFGTLFYLVFFLMNIINNIKENRKFIASEITILLSNTFLYYSAGMMILRNINEGIYQGLFTVLIAIFNFIFAFVLYRNKKVDTNLVYLLIGLVLTFLSLSAPVQLKGNHITLFWAAETVLLFWLSQKSGIRLIKLGSIIVMVLMFVSLVMDWKNVYSGTENLTILFNKGFITSITALAAINLSLILLKREGEILLYDIPKDIYRMFLTGAFIIFLYTSGLLELTYQLNYYIESSSFRTVITGSYNLFFILSLMIYTNLKRNTTFNLAATLLGIAGILAFIIYYHLNIVDLRNNYLYNNTVTFGSYSYHYILTAFAIIILFMALKNISDSPGIKAIPGKAFFWFFTFAIVFIGSAELDHLVLLLKYSPGLSSDYIIGQNHKIGFPILWGLTSFILMTVGMRKKIKDLRIISLSLFFITLLKLFIFDIKEISEGGKIAAFICLGVLLLIISFMYQKLKKLIMEDEAQSTQ